MIYGRAGLPVTIKRRAVMDDVQKLDGRKPGKQDRDAFKNGSYIVVADADTGQERLYHLAFLRADDGSAEITRAIEALGQPRFGAQPPGESCGEAEHRAVMKACEEGAKQK